MNQLDLIYSFSYPVVITFIFGGVYFFFRLKIHAAERRKLRSIKKREMLEAVETDSPLDNQEEELREKGITGIEDRFSFIQKVLPLFLFSLWIIIVSIPYLGRVPNVYISILAAAISVVAGVSLRPFLENLFSGVVISFFRSIKIGDTVRIDGHYGVIEEIGLTYSVLKRWDWYRVVIPNSKMLQKEIENMTMNDSFLWAHVKFYVSPDADLALVEKLAKQAARSSKYMTTIEEPSFWVIDMSKESLECWVAAWVDGPSDAWEIKSDIRTQLLKDLQANNIAFHKFNIDHGDKFMDKWPLSS